MNELASLAKEYGFKVSYFKEYVHFRKSLGLNPEFDVAVRQGEAERYFGSPCYPAELTTRMMTIGNASMQDVRQAQISLASARANLASYTRAVEQDRNDLVAEIGCPRPDDLPVGATLLDHDHDHDRDALLANALSGRTTYVDQVAADHDYVASAQNHHDLAQARYRSGTDSFLTLLDAQRTLYTAQRQLMTDTLAKLSNQITLYKVPGGGWQENGTTVQGAGRGRSGTGAAWTGAGCMVSFDLNFRII